MRILTANGTTRPSAAALFGRFRQIIQSLVASTLIGLPTPALVRAEVPYLEMLHLWATDEEHFALDAFGQAVRRMGVDWQEQVTTTNFTGVKSILSERLTLGVPPTAVQWIGGREDVLALHDAGVFRLISSEHFDNLRLEGMRPEIAEIVSHQDGYLLLPTGIHLLSHVIYNQDVLDAIGAEVPQDWDAFIAAAEAAREAGYFGLAISDERWQLRNLMHGLLISELTLAGFRSLTVDFDEQGFEIRDVERAFQSLRRLQPLANPNEAELPWAEAVGLTASGRAMASVIGDFASPLLPEDGNFTCGLPPGNDYYLWAFDTFALVDLAEPAAIAGQRALVSAVSDPANQTLYITRKGGIPAFQGVDSSALNGCSQVSASIWESSRPRLFLPSRAWTQNMNVISNVARTFWRDPQMTAQDAAERVTEKLSALSLLEKS
ncbi:extracellular solute-binding protein [Palleronia caenipelagi]|uniref:Extracellular solute-binding protein n=1 Tax=Palleronia caenipelagi TaxID=2489174 RepID=A0A547Q0B7_9RHOB|nr:extracellular solute-binding protein [Palleronia caenipelagi]TRD19809.1 extracellular solute-binding protein [Palleronia caenipelagi]